MKPKMEKVKKSKAPIKKSAKKAKEVALKKGKHKAASKSGNRQLTIKESFFRSTSRPKPQATASAKMKASSKASAGGREAELPTVEDEEPELEEANNNYVLGAEATKHLKMSAVMETNNNYEPLEGGGDHITETDDDGAQLSPDRSVRASPQKPELEEDVSRFKCKVCPEWFPNRYFQRKHMLIAHEDQVYECRVCAFTSVEPEKLRNHILKLHVTKKEKSGHFSIEDMQDELEQLIERKVPRKVMMEDGVSLGRNVNSKMKYACALCNRIYSSKYALERHVRCHTLEKPYECDVCDFKSSYREHMMRHMTSVHLIVHSNEPVLKYVKKRKKLESGEIVVLKDEAMIEDSQASKKKRNILRQRYECAVCGMKSSHKSDLVEHIKEKHPNAHIESMKNHDGSKVHLIVTASKQPKASKKLSISCQHCSLKFHDTWKYKVHLRSHTGVKPFSCSECEFRATSKMTVRDHIHRKHIEVTQPKIFLRTVGIDGEVEEVALAVPWREFKCEYCQEDLKDNYSLKMHKAKEHKGELPFQCLRCEHKDVTKANMIMHCLKEHEGADLDTLMVRYGKPVKVAPVRLPLCEICSKVFSYKSQLNNHLRLHTGERLFQCEHCAYKTNVKVALQNHIKRFHLPFNKPRKPAKTTSSSSKKSTKVKSSSKAAKKSSATCMQ